MCREQLPDCLKKWEHEFSDLIKNKRRVLVEEDTMAVLLEMQVDPGMI